MFSPVSSPLAMTGWKIGLGFPFFHQSYPPGILFFPDLSWRKGNYIYQLPASSQTPFYLPLFVIFKMCQKKTGLLLFDFDKAFDSVILTGRTCKSLNSFLSTALYFIYQDMTIYYRWYDNRVRCINACVYVYVLSFCLIFKKIIFWIKQNTHIFIQSLLALYAIPKYIVTEVN